MEITLEKIDLIRKRAAVTYKEAKDALEKNEGDVVEALAYLEELNKIKPENELNTSSFWKKVKRIYIKTNAIRFVVSKDNATLLNIGIPLALLVAIITMPLAIALLILAFFTGCKIRFIKNTGEEYSINSSIDDIANKAGNLADKVAQEIKKI
ncbi:MAG: ubiquitin [Firmicutes bacterium HGW-Firmicutes-12]|jgi:hypothetical protein|nr:MAG: ubiquitin [Firmicutes bacterium HGW-Firmicutes-12]